MEGLIPFLIHAMKKQNGRPHHHHGIHRSFSTGSSRSYHLLIGGGGGGDQSREGSSHRRTRSEFQPPSLDLLEQRYSAGITPNSKSFDRGSSSNNSLLISPPPSNSNSKTATTSTAAANNNNNLFGHMNSNNVTHRVPHQISKGINTVNF